jgi:hypothetical protein
MTHGKHRITQPIKSSRSVKKGSTSEQGLLRKAKTTASRPKVLVQEVGRDIRGKNTTPRSDVEHLQAAIEWLYTSQDVGQADGSAAAYNLVLGWQRSYPETTGYIIPTLYEYSQLANEKEAWIRATRMSEWLLTTQLPSGAFPGGTAGADNPDPNVFNTGQVIFGLVCAYQETGEDRYREAAEEACSWLVDVQADDGYWDQFDYKNHIHSYTSRVAWALLEGAAITNEAASVRYREAARKNIEWVCSRQHDNGWFEYAGFTPDSKPYLHTIAYTIRGLLETASRLDASAAMDSALHAAERLRKLQEQRGILTGAYDESWVGEEYYCLTGNAQMALVWLRSYELTEDRSYRSAVFDTLEFLKQKQRLSGPPMIQGGLAGSSPIWGDYMYLRYPNWAAKFLADAFILRTKLGGQL